MSEPARKWDGRFRPGERRTGRRKGTPNKRTQEIQEHARALLGDPEYQKNLLERLRNGQAPHMETLLFHYGYGKPPDKLHLGQDAEAKPLTILWGDESAEPASEPAPEPDAEASGEC